VVVELRLSLKYIETFKSPIIQGFFETIRIIIYNVHMSDFHFNEDKNTALNNFQSQTGFDQITTPRMVRWMIKMGVKNEHIAKAILASAAVLFLLSAE
jgi:hypothetical protein